ncbi:MAG: Fic family protein [Proteobacteria bacterium]|nr:MAG: Fic family protein [Pseudomonadota bacterium]
MKRGLTGRWSQESRDGRDYDAFIPDNLPPYPRLDWSPELITLLGKATASVARLDGASHALPDFHLFLYSYIRKEAVLSSQIEGTQSSLSDLLLHENEVLPGVPLDDVKEVSRYVNALNQGITQVRNGREIDLSLVLELHRILLSSGRGSDKDPGSVRTAQNWIGGRTPDNCMFVPPPPEQLAEVLPKFFKYLSESSDPTLIKAALAHLQFETIHPFRDGNGRIGRLIITLLLCREKLIGEPLIYLSLYLKENRATYYSHLQAVRIEGDWETWVEFFLKGISEVADHAYNMTDKIRTQFARDEDLIRSEGKRKSHSMLELHRVAKQTPVFTAAKAEEILNQSISKPTIYAAAQELCTLKILESKLNEKGVQLFYYKDYLAYLIESHS